MSACPACGAPLYGWLVLGGGADVDPRQEVLLRRCERCGLGVAGAPAPPEAAAGVLDRGRRVSDGLIELRLPNRASVQASLGGRHWAALDPERSMYPTPEALSWLLAAAGFRVEELRFPRRGRAQGWMWQTILNELTFTHNFAGRARAGGLRPARAAERLKLGIDFIVTALAALPVLLISVPLELLAALAGRGGELLAVVSSDDARATAPGARSAS
jgi:hypothetical protein